LIKKKPKKSKFKLTKIFYKNPKSTVETGRNEFKYLLSDGIAEVPSYLILFNLQNNTVGIMPSLFTIRRMRL
jgi:hypothetical protein